MADQNSSLLAHLLAKGISLDDINNLYKKPDEEDQDDGFFKKAADYVANKRLDILNKEGLLPKPPIDSRELAASNQAIGDFDKENKTELPNYLQGTPPAIRTGMGDSAKLRGEIGEKYGPPNPTQAQLDASSSKEEEEDQTESGKGSPSAVKPKSNSDLFKMAGGGFTDDTVHALADTQKLQNQAILANQLGKASEIIGSAFSRSAPVAQESFNQNITQAGNIVKDYLQRAKQEESDPASAKSVFARESMKRLGIQVPENTSFEAIEKAFPKFVQLKGLEETVAQRREAAAARAEEMKLRREELTQRQKENKDTKEDLEYKHEMERYNKAVDEELARQNSSLGAKAQVVRRANAIKAMFEGQKPADAILQNTYELAVSIDAMLKGGNAVTKQGIEHLIPKNYRSDLTRIQDYITGKLNPAGQADFVNKMMKVVERERAVAEKGIIEHAMNTLNAFPGLKENRKDWVRNYVKAKFQVDPYAPTDSEKKALSPEVQKAKEWLAANPNHPSADQVRQRLKSMGEL